MGRANPTGARIAAGEVGLPDERARTGVAPYPGLAHRPRTGMAVALVALVCLTVTAFAPVFFNDFVLYDDPANFLNNHDFRGIGWHQFAWSWRAHILGIYQPLGWQIHSVESALWGMGPWGYHLTSVIFHTANVLVFFLVTLELLARSRPDLPAGDRCSGAALASALFAVHPLRVEAVAWASCQTYLHCATFWLLSVLAYLRANRREDPGPWRLFVCWLLALAAMLCKATAVTLPIVLLILDFYPLRRLGSGVPAGLFGPAARWVWLEKVPLLVMSAILAAAAVFVHRWEFGPSFYGTGLSSRLARASYAICFYPVKTLLPSSLTPIRPTPGGMSLADPAYWPYAAIALGVTAALILLRRRWPAGLSVWLSYLVLLAPSSGLFPLGRGIVADRYSYVPTLGWYVLLAAAIAALRPERLKRAALAAGWALALLVIPATWSQCLIWHDAETLWAAAADRLAAEVRSSPKSADAHRALAVIYRTLGRPPDALREVRAALALDPASSESHCLLACILDDKGQHEDALVEMTEAVRLDPLSFDARFDLATIAYSLGKLDMAEAEVLQALRLRQHSSEAADLLKRIRGSRMDIR